MLYFYMNIFAQQNYMFLIYRYLKAEMFRLGKEGDLKWGMKIGIYVTFHSNKINEFQDIHREIS